VAEKMRAVRSREKARECGKRTKAEEKQSS
jgi:hypothetical protein